MTLGFLPSSYWEAKLTHQTKETTEPSWKGSFFLNSPSSSSFSEILEFMHEIRINPHSHSEYFCNQKSLILWVLIFRLVKTARSHNDENLSVWSRIVWHNLMRWWFFFSSPEQTDQKPALWEITLIFSLNCGPAPTWSLVLAWWLPRQRLTAVWCIYTFLFLSPLTSGMHDEMDETFPVLLRILDGFRCLFTSSLCSSCSLRPKCGFRNWCNQLLNSATAVAVGALAAESGQEKQNPAAWRSCRILPWPFW